MKNPYEYSDKAIKLLNKKIIKRFIATKNKINAAPFDELNIISEIKILYSQLALDNKKVFLELANMQYKKFGGKKTIKQGWLNERILDNYDPVTLYIYLNEVERKRERTTEAVISSDNKTKIIKKAMRYWADMTRQYADIISDVVMIEAFKDTGVKKVRWVTEEDEKVCKHCEPLNNKIFTIDKVPEKLHWNCRCYVVPVKEK